MPCIASVILPVAVPQAYTYLVPEMWASRLLPGMRVEVEFGKQKRYSGVVLSVSDTDQPVNRLKSLLSLLDETPILHPPQLALWQWMSEYYCCTPGEVLSAALPSALKLNSETYLIRNPNKDYTEEGWSDEAYMILEALSIQEKLALQDIVQIVQRKSVYPIIEEIITREFAFLEEEMREKYKPRTETFLSLHADYRDQGTWPQLFDRTKRSEKQTRILLAYFQLVKHQQPVRKTDLLKQAEADNQALKALLDKNILLSVTRAAAHPESNMASDFSSGQELAGFQAEALSRIRHLFSEKEVVLLRGVTGSGKTRLYEELANEVIAEGGQVLYLLPEISLSAQMEGRLKETYGDAMLAYHSRVSQRKRTEIWKQVCNGHPMVVGARSALFLPFRDLRLVIVDEEHDPSYKQQEPAPRYHARDTAIFMARLFGAKTILGSATPSVESLFSARGGKYGYVEMLERFGLAQLPAVRLIDLKAARLEGRMVSFFSRDMLEGIAHTLQEGNKVLLFQNRRGFAPSQQCTSCGWRAECIHCDVSLTMHRQPGRLKCHYCGYTTAPADTCPDCGSRELELKGFGTEKIEEEIQVHFPDARVARLDADTARTKNRLEAILDQFEEGSIDILVGTQMITKGLDFDHVGLVGVLNADQTLYFPDFRSGERTFQLITQVSGRAGRRDKTGLVLVQAQNTAHPVIGDILHHDLNALYEREIAERRQFLYPPFVRLIQVTLKHKDRQAVDKGADILASYLKKELGERVLGPALPGIPRLRNLFLSTILVKLERKQELLEKAKRLISEGAHQARSQTGLSTLRIIVDVDPM